MTQRLGLRLLVARTRNRGLRNTVRLLRYHTLHFARYSTLTKMSNWAMIKAQKWLRRERVRGMPFTYFIDPVNICNLRCAVCPTGLGILGREQGMMDIEHFRAIVDQIARYAYVLELYNWGEPFLHPRIFDMIEYAHQSRISVRTSSNMNHFDARMAARTVACGLDRLIVSLDGSTQETYEKYRRGGNLSRVLKNVSLLVEEKEKQHSPFPIVLIRMLVNRYNEHQIGEVRQISQDLGADGVSTGGFFVDTTDPDQIKAWLPSDQGQGVYDYSADKLENVWRCSEVWGSMTINWDGSVAPCCWLHRKENDFDSAFVRPLSEIWNGDAYVSSRRVFARGGPREGPAETICTTCRGKPLYLRD